MSAQPPAENVPITEIARGLRCNTKFAALVIVLFPLTMALGGWQLWRAQQKTEALDVAAVQTGQQPQRVGLLGAQSPDRTPVRLIGHYAQGHDFLLDNRIFGGVVGYELITPFVDQDGTVVFVNRGWLAGMRTREQLPVVETVEGRQHLLGDIYAPEDRRRLKMYAADGWPKVIQAVDIEEMAALAKIETFPFLVRLRPGQPGVTEADWPTVNMGPERHIAYAVQWFLMGAALLAVFALGGTNLREWAADRNKKGNTHDG